MSAIPFPYDYLAAEQISDWRQQLSLPINFITVRDASERFSRALMHALGQIDDEQQATAYRAALPVLLRWALVASETAMFLDAIGDKELATKLPEYEYLSGRKTLSDCGIATSNLLTVPYPRRPLARQLVWTGKWNRWWRFPRALIAPDIRAYNHNADLETAAKATSSYVRYDNVEHIYREAVRTGARDKHTCWNHEQVQKLFAGAVQQAKLSPEMSQRLLTLMVARLSPVLSSTSKELHGLRGLRELPRDVWAGTGGYWASRLVGLEIMRRGGTVRRFHHGYNIIVIPYIEGWTTIDLAPSTHFVLPSQTAVERWRAEPVADLLCAPPPTFEALRKTKSHGEPATRKLNASSRRTRPRVLFAAEQIRGYRQWIPSWFPDAVTLDWTLRLGAALNSLPIELVCRPHPEGILQGRRHPLNDIAPVPSANFEELLPSADVVVLDGSNSRVFCLSLMSDKPVVLIDPGYKHVYAGLQPYLEGRCTILKLDYNERGLPEIDKRRLANAVLDTKPPDPELVGKFRSVFGEDV